MFYDVQSFFFFQIVRTPIIRISALRISVRLDMRTDLSFENDRNFKIFLCSQNQWSETRQVCTSSNSKNLKVPQSRNLPKIIAAVITSIAWASSWRLCTTLSDSYIKDLERFRVSFLLEIGKTWVFFEPVFFRKCLFSISPNMICPELASSSLPLHFTQHNWLCCLDNNALWRFNKCILL